MTVRNRNYDPAILHPANVPAGYTALLPGTRVRESDICRIIGTDDWRPAGELADRPSPRSGIAFARLVCPEGYFFLSARDLLVNNDIFRKDHTSQWSPVPAECLNVTATKAARKLGVGDDGFARASLAEVLRSLPLPPHHRPLIPGDILRRGDLQVSEQVCSWSAIPPAFLGEAVKAASRRTLNRRYCRPMTVAAQTWHVDAKAGHDDRRSAGDEQSPFQTLEFAIDCIIARNSGVPSPLVGTIVDRTGNLLHAFDVSEPSSTGEGTYRIGTHDGPLHTSAIRVVLEAIAALPQGWALLGSEDTPLIGDVWYAAKRDGTFGWQAVPYNTAGWQEVVRPQLKARRKALSAAHKQKLEELACAANQLQQAIAGLLPLD